MRASIERPEWGDMQGLVVSGYPHLDCAQYLLYTIDNPAAARAWLNACLDRHQVTVAIRKHRGSNGDLDATDPAEFNVNIALTARGLLRLCEAPDDFSVDQVAEYLPRFSYPFAEGMAGRDHRSRILGNTGDSAPGAWQWGGTGPGARPVHVLLMVFAANAGAVAHALTQVGPTQGMSEAGRLPPTLPLAEAQGREHFGFADGISQPILAGTVDAERFPDSTHVTALGEFVLGYRDQTGSLAGVPGLGMSDDFGRNGSYFVFTQYEQHVDEFWRIMHERTRDRQGGLAAEALASKIVGRMPDGTPLVPYGNREDNEFDFTEDPYGYGCPLGSHIRRSHERGSVDEARNRHRILRRGRSYGPRVLPGVPDPRERGLFFACLNADLERQFEFIFQNWTNNPAFSGLRAECDPLVGSAPGGCPGLFTVPGLPTPAQVSGLRRFVQVRGGQYFFLPGITALRSLAEGLCGTVGN